MQIYRNIEPWWAALTIWSLVNSVNVLQSVGFLSRVRTGNMAINQFLGYLMIALAAPAALALVAFWRAKASPLQLVGPAVYIVFVTLMVVVDYAWPVEFRSPALYSVLVPYLLLFFGSILLMGLPMFYSDKRLWLVTVVTTILLLGSMGMAMYKGVG